MRIRLPHACLKRAPRAAEGCTVLIRASPIRNRRPRAEAQRRGGVFEPAMGVARARTKTPLDGNERSPGRMVRTPAENAEGAEVYWEGEMYVHRSRF